MLKRLLGPMLGPMKRAASGKRRRTHREDRLRGCRSLSCRGSRRLTPASWRCEWIVGENERAVLQQVSWLEQTMLDPSGLRSRRSNDEHRRRRVVSARSDKQQDDPTHFPSDTRRVFELGVM
jgi:hypothetical protein